MMGWPTFNTSDPHDAGALKARAWPPAGSLMFLPDLQYGHRQNYGKK